MKILRIPVLLLLLAIPAQATVMAIGDAHYPPFLFMTPKGQPSGFDYEVLKLLEKKLGCQIELTLQEWDKAKKAIRQGHGDILIGVNHSLEREPFYDFTEPYLENQLVTFTLKSDHTIQRLSDLDNRRVAIQKGDLADDFLSIHHPKIRLYRYPTQLQALIALRHNEVDAMIGNRHLGLYWIQRLHLEESLNIAERPVLTTHYGIAVAKGTHQRLKRQLDRAILDAKQKGELQAIEARWLGDNCIKKAEHSHFVRFLLFIIGLASAVLMIFGYVILLLNRRIHAAIEKAKHEAAKVEKERTSRQEEQAQLALLKQADRLKDEFLSVISHELRTPLNAILGFGSLLNDGCAGALTPKQRALSDKILMGAEQMLQLINNLLDYAQIQAGKFSIIREPVSYAHLISDALGLMEPLANEKNLAITSEIRAPEEVWIDGPRVMQVLLNLLSNAIKFTPAHGEIHIKATLQHGLLVTEVTDTGIGVTAEDLPQLFTPFKQLDMSLTRKVGGTGLGLSISRGIIEAHQGTIEARSAGLGNGTTFAFSIPTAGDAP